MNGNDEKHVTFKIILLGDSTVGKSSLITRYTDESFQEDSMATIGNYLLNKESTSKKK